MNQLDRLYFYLTGKIRQLLLQACSLIDELTGLDRPDGDGENEH